MKLGIGALVTLLEPLTAGMRLQQRPGGCQVLKCKKAKPKQNPSADLTSRIDKPPFCISSSGKSSSQAVDIARKSRAVRMAQQEDG